MISRDDSNKVENIREIVGSNDIFVVGGVLGFVFVCLLLLLLLFFLFFVLLFFLGGGGGVGGGGGLLANVPATS